MGFSWAFNGNHLVVKGYNCSNKTRSPLAIPHSYSSAPQGSSAVQIKENCIIVADAQPSINLGTRPGKREPKTDGKMVIYSGFTH